ncbi:hypothetical protein PMNALOAF_3315 [Methylobacterium adhaesivum]|jgi:hypothetical protein|uniref:Uncharacterized protein n=1 Tax=Methylobacterium adhaesivum TaxID=333297 RepID=A0ABT8BJP9_9HYPH|nr:hypothetical protein [Methylobacterium adhaesivum]MDN3591712.1 hypothetical protein [Methylobacterium adhaesivum]GJD32050.1 hypothetical protein PMNALOAF_3315 [Methylobacterium adhaesivum]
MRTPVRVSAAIAVGIAVALAVMAHDRQRGIEWAISPEQIADAQGAGKPGVETGPGQFARLPVASEGADLLPVKWGLIGLFAACVVLVGTGHRGRLRL